MDTWTPGVCVCVWYGHRTDSAKFNDTIPETLIL